MSKEGLSLLLPLVYYRPAERLKRNHQRERGGEACMFTLTASTLSWMSQQRECPMRLDEFKRFEKSSMYIVP